MKTYHQHIQTLTNRLEESLAGLPYDGVVYHSGILHYYFEDDQPAPFRSNPHFAHWVPLPGPGHAVVARPGRKPRLIAMIPEDYWYEPVTFANPFWLAEFDFVQVADKASFQRELGSAAKLAFVGEAEEDARLLGFDSAAINDALLTARLDWDRTVKTDYEVECIDEAARLAALAHRAAKQVFLDGASEIEIHHAYVAAIGCIDAELPYESIVAIDEKGAFLHYVNKRKERGGHVLLIDSGATHLGYASDITRTWTKDSANGRFREMRDAFDTLEQSLCQLVEPGVHFVDLQIRAHQEIAEFLVNFEILRGTPQSVFENGLTRPFFPHGLGHDLGIQVHDIAGRQASRDGGTNDPPPEYPFLRNTRQLQPGNVVTIEPGCYFIDMLLRPHRDGAHSSSFNWPLIDELKSHGGIRTEDDLLVTESGIRNLTRPHLPE